MHVVSGVCALPNACVVNTGAVFLNIYIHIVNGGDRHVKSDINRTLQVSSKLSIYVYIYIQIYKGVRLSRKLVLRSGRFDLSISPINVAIYIVYIVHIHLIYIPTFTISESEQRDNQ